jgi:hypothetical protein
MRQEIARSALAAALAAGLALIAPASTASSGTPGSTTPSFGFAIDAAAAVRAVERPVRGVRATAPPAGARTSTSLRMAPGLVWKSDPATHAVFAVGADRQIWFVDAGTGWPYTVTAVGEVFTADPRDGSVYSLGRLSSWTGDLLYLFSFWDIDGGRYRLPAYDTWVTYYADDRVESFGWDETYTEVWEYDEFYASDDYAEVELAMLDPEADALDAEADALDAEADALEDEADALDAEAEALEDEAYADAAADALDDEADALEDEADVLEDEADALDEEADDAEEDYGDDEESYDDE